MLAESPEIVNQQLMEKYARPISNHHELFRKFWGRVQNRTEKLEVSRTPQEVYTVNYPGAQRD